MHVPRRLALCVLLVACLALPAGAQVMRVYQVRQRTAEELLPIAETALAGEGRAMADRRTNAIVLSGPSRAVEGALTLLRQLDVRAQMVHLRYEARSQRSLAAQGVRVVWSAGSSGLRIGNVVWPGADGAVVAVQDASSRGAQQLRGELRILDGQSGRIATGTSLPVTARRVQPGPAGPQWSETTSYVSADSGFEARPRVLANGRIELSLRPFEAGVRPDGSLAHAGADTVLLLEAGKTLAVGGLLRDSHSQGGGALSGGGSESAREQSLLLVSAEIE